jgi:polar amino acid transport system substrate-binding protein
VAVSTDIPDQPPDAHTPHRRTRPPLEPGPARTTTAVAHRFAAIVLCLIAITTSCALPADTSGTLQRATGGTLRVGVSADEPWTSPTPTEPPGVEQQLLAEFATGIDARIAWTHGGESTLMHQLHDRDLDIVIGGLTTESPWTDHAALTRPYVVTARDDGTDEEHVIAVALGENALLVAIERFLIERSHRIAADTGGAAP